MKDYKKLEDYGIIGDLDTCALVGRDGSIDWFCLSHIESPSIFAGMLDIDKGGHFVVCPTGVFDSKQRYIEKTNVLQTVFSTTTGLVTLIDFMPVRGAGERVQKGIYRKLVCNKGFMDLEVNFKPRFGYACSQTILKSTEEGIVAIGNNDTERVFLNSPLSFQIRADEAFGTYSIKEGDSLWLALQYDNNVPVSTGMCEDALKDTVQYWMDWVHSCNPLKCIFEGPWHELIVRSGLVLKLLTHRETGAIYAAPTTSLPEEIGGIRNWDYRFSWIRDSSFTVQALYNLGHSREAKDYLKFIMGICRNAGDPSKIQIMYGLHGELDMEERELPHLSGYRNSRPVRIGNAAAKQRQLDIYGELVNAIYEATRHGEDISQEVWHFVKKIVDYVCRVWNTKAAGIWEVRSEPQHFVYSKLMCWVAIDRGLKIADKCGFEAPISEWERVRSEIKDRILERGFSNKLNSFVQTFDAETLDATSLLIPITGFLPFDDPHVQGTIDATLKGLLTKDCLVFRYQGEDGLRGSEGAFTLCTFWLVNALSLSGRVKEAEEVFMNILKYLGPLGLLAEEINPDTGGQLGNFPQAFSHIGLINSALYLGRTKGRRQTVPEPLGTDTQ
jgi:GH15 family glucan-1,4-alpha-glucosidase